MDSEPALARYSHTRELNFEVDDKDAKIAEIKEHYKGKAKNMFEIDGLSVEFDDWWFNVRASNTEPKIRLNLEAHTKELMEEKRDELKIFLAENGIETKIHYPELIHAQKPYNCKNLNLINSEILITKILTLPLANISNDEIIFVGNKIKDFFGVI